MGIVQFLLSTLGIYASWERVTSRMKCLLVYAIGCFILTVLESLYFLALIASRSERLRNFASSFVASNTFAELTPLLSKVFELLGKNATFLVVFSSVCAVLFDIMTTYWAYSLYYEALEIIHSSAIRIPLIRPPPPRATVAGFGSFGRGANQPTTPPRPGTHPFAGRGYRLGSS